MIIKNERLKHSILTALADREMMKILDSSIFLPKSINDVIGETNIPHTTAYRKINWMLEQGLLVVEKIQITEDGKKHSLIMSSLKSFNIRYEHGNLVVEGEQNIDTIGKIAERLFSLDLK